MTTFDALAFKKSTHGQWNAVADRWNAWGPLLDSWLGPVSEALLDMAKVGPGHRVLHIAGGSGQEALQSARRVGPSGHVLTTDLSEALTALAAANLETAGYKNASAQVMDGEQISLAGEPFDAVLSRVGLIYFPDQQRALIGMRHVLKPGGKMAAIVYSTPENNKFFSVPVAIIRRRAQLPPPLPGRLQPGASVSPPPSRQSGHRCDRRFGCPVPYGCGRLA
jgi:SAM-dependent methyltransferase